MRSARRFGAFASGLLLYITAISISGALASSGLLRGFYAPLGGRYSGPTIIIESALIALLIFVLALGWSLATVRPLAPGRRPVTSWCLAGVATAWLGGVIYGTVYLSVHWNLNDLPVGLWLLSPVTPPLWGVLNTLAVVGGVVLARRHMVPSTHGFAPNRA